MSRVASLGIFVSGLAFGCTGAVVAPTPTQDSPPVEPGAPVPPKAVAACALPRAEGGPLGSAPLRRLTIAEYNNSVRDLFNDDSRPADAFPPDGGSKGFKNSVETAAMSPLLAEGYQLAAEQVAVRAVGQMNTWLPCDVTSQGETTCASEAIAQVGQRVWRRPLASDEQANLLALFQTVRREGDFVDAIQAVIETMLISPQFLYRIELGEPVEGRAIRSPTPWEMASRLSFTFWGAPPDAPLIEAAAAGRLRQRAEIQVQASRLLADTRAQDQVRTFFDEWFRLERITTMTKDMTHFPRFKAGQGALLRSEATTFIDRVVWGESGTVATLLTAPFSYATPEVADFYGVPHPSGAGWEQIITDPIGGSGLLTQAGLLAALGKPDRTSPVLRGAFVREQLLCAPPPPPPPNVNMDPPASPTQSERDRLAQHRANPACAGCHALMDPIGLGFEGYDGIGLHRELENGAPIDTQGELTQTDVDGAFSSPRELGRRLAESAQVKDCFALQWFRFASGRGEDDRDACSLETLRSAIRSSDGDVKALLLAMADTDAFLYLPEAE